MSARKQIDSVSPRAEEGAGEFVGARLASPEPGRSKQRGVNDGRSKQRPYSRALSAGQGGKLSVELHWWRLGRERRIADVPRLVVWLLVLALLTQVAWHVARPAATARADELPAAGDASLWRALSLGDEIALSKAMMLWLQNFDNQPGISIPFKALDYTVVQRWLDVVLELDPRAQYPLLAAARVYGEVSDPARQRLMLEFVERKFHDDPDRRWPWLAHAALIAKHRLNDLPLALKFAQALADKTSISAVPSWARQMHIFLREDMGETESARILLGGLLDSGTITDEHELRFLQERLNALRATPDP